MSIVILVATWIVVVTCFTSSVFEVEINCQTVSERIRPKSYSLVLIGQFIHLVMVLEAISDFQSAFRMPEWECIHSAHSANLLPSPAREYIHVQPRLSALVPPKKFTA